MRAVRQGLDLILVGVVVALTLFGLLMVYSAGPKFASYMNMPADYFLVRQLMWAGVGLVVIVIMTFVNYHIFQKLTVILMILTLILLGVVMVTRSGHPGFGALDFGRIDPPLRAGQTGHHHLRLRLVERQTRSA